MIVDLPSSLMSDFIVPDTMVDLMRESPGAVVASQEIVVVIRIMEVTEVLELAPIMLVID